MTQHKSSVAIIGAGVSGLALANSLHEIGHPVQVLEARDRVGGRLHSISVGGSQFDLGATWFWPGEQRVISLAAELGLEVFGQWLQGDAVAEQEGSPTVRLNGNPMDVPSYRVAGGLAQLAIGLADRLPEGTVELGRPVTQIRRGEGSVLVETSDARLESEIVVVAIPPSLAVPHLLDPKTLPASVAATAAQTPVWMGASAKVVVVYPEPFWREGGLAGSGMSYVGPLRELHDMSPSSGSHGAIFGFASTGDPRLTRAEALEQMVRLFGPAAADPVDVQIVDWGTDPNTVVTPNSPRPRYDLYGAPELTAGLWDDRLFFCSTETAAHNPGHVEGALQAAERTVSLITASG